MSLAVESAPRSRPRRPRLGFVGVGWIGRHRLEAVADSGLIEVAAIADPVVGQRRDAGQARSTSVLVGRLDELWEHALDGVVIATPSALHAEQSIAALERGLAVFCQKPLGRCAAEVEAVVDAARRADCPLGVDFCYRHVEAARRIRAAIAEGALGRIFAVNLVFHNAYGPDKAWFYDRASSGGGCMMDLGIHLVDLLLWALDSPAVVDLRSQVLADGRPLDVQGCAVEDYAIAQLELAGGVAVQLACSWRLAAGRDAVIEAAFYGTEGGAVLRNVGGSFYDFVAELHRGTTRERLSQPPDEWGGRAICEWARRVADGEGFDSSRAREHVEVAALLDRIYASHSGIHGRPR